MQSQLPSLLHKLQSKNNTIIDKEKAFRLIDDMARHQVYSFGIGGGEPLVLPYLSEMIKQHQ